MRETKVTPAVLERVKQSLIKATANWETGLCMGFWTNLKGEDRDNGHVHCHSWLSTPYYKYQLHYGHYDRSGRFNASKVKEDPKNFLIANCHSRNLAKCSKEACDYLVKWMARESPFSEFILNRDDDESLCNGGVIMLCGPDGIQYQEAMWLCKVLRFHTEGSQAADVFKDLVEAGVDGMLAIYIANYVRNIKQNAYVFSGIMSHMATVSADTDILGMIERNTVPEAKHTGALFKRTNKQWETPSANVTKLKGFTKPMKQDDGWGGLVEVVGATKENFIAQVLEWQKTIVDGNIDLAKAQQFRISRMPPEPVMPTSSTVYLELDM